MTNDTSMNDTTMLGTFTLDGDVPVEPEIVLANCTDAAMLGQLVSVFQDNPYIRFFLVNTNEADIDLNGDFHFIKDSGNWVLANSNTMHNVRFDNADFNPAGSESTFSLIQAEDGSHSIALDEAAQVGLIDTDSFFIDPSVLDQGESEIVLSNFTVGSDVLELPADMAIKDIFVDNEHDLTNVIVGQNNDVQDDIVVKLLGVSQQDLPTQDFGLDAESTTDDLINHLISSGMNVE